MDISAVTTSHEMRKLGLIPGTKMVVIATEDGAVLRKGAMLFATEPPAGLLRKIRAMFSKVPIRNIE